MLIAGFAGDSYTLRIVEPRCDLNEKWLRIELPELISVMLSLLNSEIFDVIKGEANETTENKLELILKR